MPHVTAGHRLVLGGADDTGHVLVAGLAQVVLGAEVPDHERGTEARLSANLAQAHVEACTAETRDGGGQDALSGRAHRHHCKLTFTWCQQLFTRRRARVVVLGVRRSSYWVCASLHSAR